MATFNRDFIPHPSSLAVSELWVDTSSIHYSLRDRKH
jgi:hypothetical protein